MDFAGLDAELHEITVRGSMSGSGEKHTMYFYVHRDRLTQAPIEAWWQRRVARARELGGVSRQTVIDCARRVIDGESLAVPAQAGRIVSDMCTVSLLDTMILDSARRDAMQ